METDVIKKEKAVALVNDAVGAYFREIRRFKLLTLDEEKALAKKVKKGDMRAREALINANLRLAIYIAKKYLHKAAHLKFADLIEAGNEGLIKAADRFNPKIGCRFSTYATFWIRQTVERELENNDQVIRRPVHAIASSKRYNKTVHVLTHKLDRAPTIEEIAAAMKKSEAWVQRQREAFKKYVSLDEPFADGSDTLNDFIEGSDGTEAYAFAFRSEFKEKFTEMFESSPLDDKQKEVLRLRYGIGSD